VLGDELAVGREKLGESVDSVDTDLPLPRQVVEPHVVQLDAIGRHLREPREEPLQPDRDVAQPDGTVPGVQQRTGHDAHRVREIHDPRAGRGASAGTLGGIQHHRHGPQRLREATGTGRLLAEAATLQRPRLVADPRRLAAHPQLQQHDVRVGDPGVQVGCRDDARRVTEPGQDPARHARDEPEPFGVRVHEDQLVYLQRVPKAADAVHQLRCVGGAPTHDGHLHPLTPVRLTPSTNAF